MEHVQHQQAVIRPSFPATSKWPPDSTAAISGDETSNHGNDGGSFGQDSGYNSYQATSCSTFNWSSRHEASVMYATIDEGNENDCSLNDSSSGPSAISLTPRTAASMDLLSKIHLTTPKTADQRKLSRRPSQFDYDGIGGTSVENLSFLAPSTPDRLLGMSRPSNDTTQDTPRRTGNRSANQPIQLTPHKAKGGSHSLKRKHSSSRGKLYSDEDVPLGDENRSSNLNDSFDVDCRRLENISPILNTKRRKHYDRGIEDLMRSSTPKTASSQPTFLRLNAVENRPAAKMNLRKFQSFSPSKMQTSYARPFLRHNPMRALERTPEKKKEHRVLAEIDRESSENTAVPPQNFGALLGAPILDDPVKQLEHTVSIVPSFDDFSLTPSKVSLIDPELMPRSGVDEPFADEDFVVRHAPNYSYAPTLDSILEESPVRITAKQPVPKSPPSVSKSGRKLKRLGTNGTVSAPTASCVASPARSVRSLSRQSVRASVSPKVRRSHDAQNQSLKTFKTFNYCGFEYVNILHQLAKRNWNALEVLLEYLADTDLVQVVRVSRGWRSIIQNHRKSRKRLERYLKHQRPNKENAGVRQANGGWTPHAQLPPEIKEQIEHNDTIVGDSDVPGRKPFKLLNSRSDVSRSQLYRRFSSNAQDKSATVNVTQSPQVSPSKRKFVTNQKIASQLKQNEQLRKCPRCEHPSRLIFSRTTQAGFNKTQSSADHVHSSTETARNNNEYSEKSPAHVRKNLFNSSTPSTVVETSLNHSSNVRLNSSELYRCEEQHMKLRSSAASKNASCPSISSASEDQQDVRDSKCDYAICSGKFCGFKFCIKCLGVYHPNTVCADLSLSSPTKEEDRGHPNVACTRQSRRSLMRLCKKH